VKSDLSINFGLGEGLSPFTYFSPISCPLLHCLLSRFFARPSYTLSLT